MQAMLRIFETLQRVHHSRGRQIGQRGARRAPWILGCAGLLLWAGLAFAADYSGTYKGDAQSSSGKVENKLVLQTKGSELTGTLTNQFGVLTLTDGHVDGQDLYFVVTVKEEGDPFRMVYRGHIFGDEIQFKIEAGERQLDLVTKKVS